MSCLPKTVKLVQYFFLDPNKEAVNRSWQGMILMMHMMAVKRHFPHQHAPSLINTLNTGNISHPHEPLLHCEAFYQTPLLFCICLEVYMCSTPPCQQRCARLFQCASENVKSFRKVNSDLPALLDEWATSLFRELDYVREAQNGVRFKKLYGELEVLCWPLL